MSSFMCLATNKLPPLFFWEMAPAYNTYLLCTGCQSYVNTISCFKTFLSSYSTFLPSSSKEFDLGRLKQIHLFKREQSSVCACKDWFLPAFEFNHWDFHCFLNFLRNIGFAEQLYITCLAFHFEKEFRRCPDIRQHLQNICI